MLILKMMKMKNNKIKNIAIVSAFMAGNLYLMTANSQNLITNPTFDVDLTGWTGNAYSVSPTIYAGSAYPSFTSNKLVAYTNNANSGNQNISQSLNITTSGNYRLSFSYGIKSAYNISVR